MFVYFNIKHYKTNTKLCFENCLGTGQQQQSGVIRLQGSGGAMTDKVFPVFSKYQAKRCVMSLSAGQTPLWGTHYGHTYLVVCLSTGFEFWLGIDLAVCVCVCVHWLGTDHGAGPPEPWSQGFAASQITILGRENVFDVYVSSFPLESSPNYLCQKTTFENHFSIC